MKNLDGSTQNKTTSYNSRKSTEHYAGEMQENNTSTFNGTYRTFSGDIEPNSTKATYSSYNDFLKTYGSKRFNPVKVELPVQDVPKIKSTEASEKKSKKSEIFIQVNNSPNGISSPDVTDFVNRKQASIPPPPKFPEKPLKSSQNFVHIHKLTNGDTNPVMHNFSHNKQISPTPKSPEIVSDEMIYAKTAVLQELMKKSLAFNEEDTKTHERLLPESTVVTRNYNHTTNGIPPAPKLPNYPILPEKSKHLQTLKPSQTDGHKFTDSVPNCELNVNDIPKNALKKSNSFAYAQQIASTHDNGYIPPPPKFLTQRTQSANIEANTTTIVPTVDNSSTLNKKDPNVKKLVYNTYRGFLGAYNNKANDMVATLPRTMVSRDRGVSKQVESMATQAPTGPPGVGRHKSDISDRREPPLVVQNAMLTKDKKPFTYTPGGIDLSEIKSPRLGRRIEINANAPGVAEVNISSLPQGYVGQLPPGAQAAMQSALPVQVFPTAPPPPPPPPSVHIPPPPPMGPLPTKPIATTEGVFERPDMTKIIPENPMALLRKTPAPVNRRSFIEDEFYPPSRPQNVEPQYNAVPPQQFNQAQVQTQPRPQPQSQPQFTQPKPQPQMVSQPQYVPNSTSTQYSQPEVKTSTAQLGSLYIPPVSNTQEIQKSVTSLPSPPQRRVESPSLSPESPQSPIAANLNKAPRPWQNQKPSQQDLPPWAQRSQSPPSSQQRSPPVQVQQQGQASPPIQQQQRATQQLPSNTVQQQQQQQQRVTQQLPSSPSVQQQSRITQQVKSPQQQPNQPTIIGRVIIPVQSDTVPVPNSKNVDAVYVTQPVVLQHPGPQPEGNRQTNQQQRTVQPQLKQQASNESSKGTRIIPIQIEGASNSNIQRQESKFTTPGTTPATPGSARSFNRQPSWSSTPTQSNSFKVIQKMTNTDGEDDDDQVSVEHAPKNSQHFQQAPTEQVRKLNLTDGDLELMNKFKQGVDEENSIHKEVDPRYRGSAIPSKAFRFLQSMTDGSDDTVSASVPRGQQGGSRSPQVRTIPVQIEGDTSGKPYVPPSEQTVQEPKKYTGSAIPSRSFKMLQAMTGDTCADVTQANENNENYHFDPPFCWGYNPNFLPPLPPPPPYWQYYYSPSPTPCCDLSKSSPDAERRTTADSRNTPTPFNLPKLKGKYRDSGESESETESTKRASTNNKNTPLPFWGYYPQPNYTKQAKDNADTDSDSEQAFTYSRSTPLPFWGCYSPFYPIPYSNNETDSEAERTTDTSTRSTPAGEQEYSYNSAGYERNRTDEENQHNSTTYPQFWNPYTYYPYFYGYPAPPPPMYPYPFYPPIPSDSEEFAGYSSTDEVAYYNSKCNKHRGKTETDVSPIKLQNKILNEVHGNALSETCVESSSSDGEPETEVEEDESLRGDKNISDACGLQAIKSVSDINIYNVDDSHCTDDEDNASDGTTTDENDDFSIDTEGEIIPHQLSIIYEESERGDASRLERHVRESSVATTASVETVTLGNVDEADLELQHPIITEPGEESSNLHLLETYNSSFLSSSSNKIFSPTDDLYSNLKARLRSLSSSPNDIDNESFLSNEDAKSIQPELCPGDIQNSSEVKVQILPNLSQSPDNNAEIKSESGSNSSEDWWSLIGNKEADDLFRKGTELQQQDEYQPEANNDKQGEEISTNSIEDSRRLLNEVKSENKEEEEQEEEIDFWKIIESNDTENTIAIKNTNTSEEVDEDLEEPITTESMTSNIPNSLTECDKTDDTYSTSSRDSSSVCSEVSDIREKNPKNSEAEETICTNEHIYDHAPDGSLENEVKMPSIKDRIRALQEASKNRFGSCKEDTNIKRQQSSVSEEDRPKMSVSEDQLKISVFEEEHSRTSKSMSTKSSIKSFEDISEDEIDSGVTSDISRHISDNESDFPELRKMTKYQRAATHSRLFQLLQDECENEDNMTENEEKIVAPSPDISNNTSITRKDTISKGQLGKERLSEEMLIRRGSLTLPLHKNSESDSFSSSGINSPGSPVINERLVNELVQSLLRRKKGHIFRNMPTEKLHSAAFRILQEEMEASEVSHNELNSFLSPLKNSTENSSAAQTPQEFYGNYSEYAHYYNSWSEAERLYEANYDILPSKAFKLIQEQAILNKTGGISGFLARCPRILSSKNIHKELMSVLESRKSPTPNPDQTLESKGAASAS